MLYIYMVRHLNTEIALGANFRGKFEECIRHLFMYK